MTRKDEVVGKLRAEAEAGRAIIGAGAGTGLSAKTAEAGGADLIIIYNSGRYRMAGRGSLAVLADSPVPAPAPMIARPASASARSLPTTSSLRVMS
ncbi:MAG: phosphoenolpyruvate hydrolase family protein [Egibacteraceae bacterium]